jgi:hypothetical protein
LVIVIAGSSEPRAVGVRELSGDDRLRVLAREQSPRSLLKPGHRLGVAVDGTFDPVALLFDYRYSGPGYADQLADRLGRKAGRYVGNPASLADAKQSNTGRVDIRVVTQDIDCC